jgi:lysozyme
MQSKLKRSLILHEGYKDHPYFDTVGNITIGIGYNLSDRGLPDEWINRQYQDDVEYFYNQLCTFPWFELLSTDRQIVLIDMAFMGWKKFLSFKNMIKALEQGDYHLAASEMLKSNWAVQVGNRAITLANVMNDGVYHV